MPIAADTPDDRAEQSTLLTERLTGILEREQAQFRERRPVEAAAHAEERDKLTRVYTEEMAVIHRDRSLIEGAAPALLARLKQATARFREVVSAHSRSLAAIRTVSEDMMKAVATRANAKAQGAAGYGQNAALRPAGAGAPASLALNQVI